VVVDGEEFRLDAAYPRYRIGIEYQGWDPHRTRSAFDADHRRDRLLTLAGWSILYFTSATTAGELVDHITRLRSRSRQA
jgi:very-short-patch-repair endonuclease